MIHRLMYKPKSDRRKMVWQTGHTIAFRNPNKSIQNPDAVEMKQKCNKIFTISGVDTSLK